MERHGKDPELDEELLEEGGGVPRGDALDTGDAGAPDEALGRDSRETGPVTARQSAAGSGVKVEELRDRGEDYEEDRDEPPLGGPSPRDDR